MISLIFASLTLLLLIPFSIELILGIQKLHLLHTTPQTLKKHPTLTIVVAVLNEENHIQTAVQSWLELDYPNLEIIIVNDRSSDNTGSICNNISTVYPHVQVVHIDRLQEGWIGKNYALHLGAGQATTDYILFTDGDVSMHPSTLKRAMHYIEQKKLDHLSALFHPQLPTGLLNMIFLDFWLGLCGWFKPWQASNPKSSKGMGIGAFNLIHRQKYLQAGGHYPVRLSPVDDILLGIHLKQQGLKQECVNGMQLISVPWYDSLKNMIQGLSKNSFAGLDFSITKVLLASLFILVVQIWPWWALLFYTGIAKTLNIVFLSTSILVLLLATAQTGIARSCIIWLPLSPYIRLFILVNSVLKNIRQKGIYWRGTFYPLKDLQKAHQDFRKKHSTK